jgi:hypothetical protein
LHDASSKLIAIFESRNSASQNAHVNEVTQLTANSYSNSSTKNLTVKMKQTPNQSTMGLTTSIPLLSICAETAKALIRRKKAQTHIAKPQRFAPKHALLNKLQAH